MYQADYWLNFVCMRHALLLISLLASCISNAQVIPAERRVDWSIAGYQGDFPNPEKKVNVTEYGVVGDSVTDNHQAITDAIVSLDGESAILFFPPGWYMINSPLILPDSIILRGATADSTKLMFDFGGQALTCIRISKGQSGDFTAITSGYEKDSYEITVNNPGDFQVGDYAEIREENGSWDTEPVVWADYSVGQIVKIVDIVGSTLFLRNPLRIDYEENLNPEIRKIDPVYNTGIECLKISRLDEPAEGAGYNILFDFAAQCWVIGVESDKSVGSHIYISHSTNIEVSGCYIHDAFTYDGAGTRGYGILVHNHSGECLITNNILKHLRHALIVKTGANGNVISYNYSIEPYRSEPIHDFSGDISLHGHYAFCNLFEGNIVQNIIIDHYWGPSGPYNTFFRNRAELYGIILTNSDTTQTNQQNIVGNEITDLNPFYGLYYITGTDHFEYGNNVKGIITPAGTNDLPDSTYYLDSAPEFWNIQDEWPSLGIPNELDEGTIPAKIRYLLGDYTICRDTSLPVRISFPEINTASIHVWPNPCKKAIFLEGTFDKPIKTDLHIYNYSGAQILEEKICLIPGQTIRLGLPLHMKPGFYFIRISGMDISRNIKIIKY